ncbi:MAG: hypothetical protein HC929_01125 [Leptolyngbyaceae cyanobacterium SM2_5_2]|nr:hypothetical protein [Leptolyngbyaceae cyanobacterium SM2_5_2]
MENVASKRRTRSHLWSMLRWFLLAEAIVLALIAGIVVLTAMGSMVGDRTLPRTAPLDTTFPQ